MSSRFNQLKLFQKFYLFALFLLLLLAINDDLTDSNLNSIGLIALLALAIELWPKVVATWETLLGRVLIILSYAIIGNFSFAFAGQELNKIVGIDPSPLYYSISFVTLVMAPLGILFMTLLVMIFYMIFIQVALLFKVLMRLLRIGHGKKNNGIKYPITTALSRLILAAPMFMTLEAAIGSYSGDLSDVSFSARKSNSQQEPVKLGTQDVLDEIKNELKKAAVENKAKEVDSTEPKPAFTELAEALEMNEKEPITRLDQAIAAFVHNVELFKHSQCVKAENEHVMYIGENDILVSKPNPNSKTGYDFSVRPCTLKSY